MLTNIQYICVSLQSGNAIHSPAVLLVEAETLVESQAEAILGPTADAGVVPLGDEDVARLQEVVVKAPPVDRKTFHTAQHAQLYYRIHRVSKKNIPNIFDCNSITNYQILIIFGMNIPDTTCHQMTIQFSTSPKVCFCTTWRKQSKQNMC